MPTRHQGLTGAGRWVDHSIVRLEFWEVASDLLSQRISVNSVEGVMQVQTQERSVRRYTQGEARMLCTICSHAEELACPIAPVPTDLAPSLGCAERVQAPSASAGSRESLSGEASDGQVWSPLPAGESHETCERELGTVVLLSLFRG